MPDDALPGPPQALAPGDPLGVIARSAADARQDQPTEDGSDVRILVVYTPALQSEQGGVVGMQALVDLMIASANQAFEDGGINPRLTLAHTALVDYVEEDRRTDLDRLVDPDDGYMDEVHALRNEHAADLVHLLTGGLRFFDAGIAYQLVEENLRSAEWAGFSLTMGTAEELFTHEIGHNFGVSHDRYVDGTKISIYPYAFGYVNNRAFDAGAPESARWRTIMAYPDRCRDAGFSCQLLFHFANPDQSYLGDPLGVPANDPETGSGGPADARLTINNSARWVASFRSESCTHFSVSPQSPVVSLEANEIVVRVDTGLGCLWEASSQAGFLVPDTEARQSGSGFVRISVEANETGVDRTGTVNVAGTTIEFRQLGVDAGICGRSYAVAQAISGNTPCDEIGTQHLSEITSLRVEGQGLTALRAGDFDGLPNLVSLNLRDNRITELPVDLFTGLSNLENLVLTRNQLAEIPVGLVRWFVEAQESRPQPQQSGSPARWRVRRTGRAASAQPVAERIVRTFR